MNYKKIPTKYSVGGQQIQVLHTERCNDNAAGNCNVWSGKIEIADKFGKDYEQCESSKVNTFYHELTHSILQTMGEDELNRNEKFVSCFAGFLADAMDNAWFLEDITTQET